MRILQRDGFAGSGPGMRKNGGAAAGGMVGGLAYRSEFSAATTGLDFLSLDAGAGPTGPNGAFTVNGSREREQRTWISMTTSMHDNEATRRAKGGIQVGRDDVVEFVDHKYPPDGIAVGVTIHRETDLDSRMDENERANKTRVISYFESLNIDFVLIELISMYFRVLNSKADMEMDLKDGMTLRQTSILSHPPATSKSRISNSNLK